MCVPKRTAVQSIASNACRKQEGMQMTTDVRKALGEKARIERDKATAKEEAARKALLEVRHYILAECACLVLSHCAP